MSALVTLLNTVTRARLVLGQPHKREGAQGSAALHGKVFLLLDALDVVP